MTYQEGRHSQPKRWIQHQHPRQIAWRAIVPEYLLHIIALRQYRGRWQVHRGCTSALVCYEKAAQLHLWLVRLAACRELFRRGWGWSKIGRGMHCLRLCRTSWEAEGPSHSSEGRSQSQLCHTKASACRHEPQSEHAAAQGRVKRQSGHGGSIPAC